MIIFHAEKPEDVVVDLLQQPDHQITIHWGRQADQDTIKPHCSCGWYGVTKWANKQGFISASVVIDKHLHYYMTSTNMKHYFRDRFANEKYPG